MAKNNGEPVYDGEVVEGEFGWEYFTLDSAEEKQTYLAVILKYAMGDAVPDYIRNMVYHQLAGKIPSEDSYIDHQSVIDLPRDWSNPEFPDAEFWEEFKNYVLTPGLVIMGGNDNGGDEHPLKMANLDVEPFQVPFTDVHRDLVARKDEAAGVWTLFNRTTGGKLRFSFDTYPPSPVQDKWDAYRELQNESRDFNPQFYKASAPELVDMKLTDYCDFGCEYCYMGSTKNGKHGKTDEIMGIITALGKLKVFEIAFGGGEALAHPDFIHILKHTKKQGIVPNFTTRDIRWLKDAEKRTEIMENIGAFAVSVSDERQVNKLGSYLEAFDIKKDRVNLHLVMGTVDQYAFERILRAAAAHQLRVTLLGYKTTGRGSDFTPKDYKWWLKSVVKLSEEEKLPVRISIDTVLAEQYKEMLENAKLPYWMYHTKDGLSSAYFDTVNMKFGAASYLNTDEMIHYEGYVSSYSYEDMKDFIENEFKKFV